VAALQLPVKLAPESVLSSWVCPGGVPGLSLVNSPMGRPSSQAYSRMTAPLPSLSAISLPSRS
jgi:hypothetical protein